MASRTLSLASASPQAQGGSASPSTLQRPPPFNAATNSRPGPSHTQSAPVLSTNASSMSIHLRNSSSASQPTSGPERSAATRGYTAHLPYNPNRPPPHTYTRQHEFPPFPPLAQHPVLPFLTTAFTNTQESQTAPLPTKPRSSLAPPRVSSAGRHTHSIISTIPTMDVSKNDPSAIFIRPPLVVPLSHNNDPSIDPSCISGAIMDGEPAPGTPLTYAILHTHRNWFLDAEDFRKDNPNRIDYPHDLEPPRGWAPLSECTGAAKQAKEKKEKNNAVRTKGSYAQADSAITDTTIEYGPSDDCHEKTVLRCTFCRREYHGPNAKSMWRRHVFDKHKVAMKNRREGSAGMAPRLSQAQKKAKAKVAESSSVESLSLGPLLSPALTLDLTNEQNLIRLLERVVSGNLDINLPASLLNSSGNGNAVNLETIALALQKSGISLTSEGDDIFSTQPALSASHTGSNADSCAFVKKATAKSRKRDEQRRERERRDEDIMRAAAGPSFGVDDTEGILLSQAGSSSIPVDDDVANCARPEQPDLPIFQRSQSPRVSYAEAASQRQKRTAEEAGRDSMLRASFNVDRAPLKDNTLLDRNNHNQSIRAVCDTPCKDKGKQKALPATPGAPKLSQESFLSSPTSPRHPYTPVRPPTALRSRALATTGEESYLTQIVSSPTTMTPGRGSGRVPFTSPFHSRTSPMKRSDWNYPPTSDDAYGNLAASPRFPFEFNIPGIQTSSSVAAFEPIPLELGNLGHARWTPPSLGSPAPVSKPTRSRPISRASSIEDAADVDDRNEARDDGDGDMELEYPDSSPSERVQNRRRSSAEDFDMEDYLDLEDAGPASDPNMPSSPCKNPASRGLQFSKEYGLLSPSEVERITASAHPVFMEEARSPKRRRLEVS